MPDDVQPRFDIPSLTILKDELSKELVIDPICGMQVDPKTAISCVKDGSTWFFCCEHCRTKFLNPQSATVEPPPPGTSYFCPMCPEVTSDHPASCPICGMALEPDLSSTSDSNADAGIRDLWNRFLVAVACSVPVFVLSMGPMIGLSMDRVISHSVSAYLQLLLSIPVVGWCGRPFWVIGAKSIGTRHWNMFTLILLGVGAAFGFSLLSVLTGSFHEHVLYFESASVITTLVLLGQILEHNARRRTGYAIRALMELTPAIAHRVTEEEESDIPIAQVMQGDLLRVRPGERVPVDGQVLGSTSQVQSASAKVAANHEHPLTTIDEAMITGEPMPVSKRAGDSVIAGTMNQSGSFVMQTQRVGRSTVLAQIVDLVAKAQRSRAPVQKLADQIAGWFTPAVVAISIVTFLSWISTGADGSLNLAFTNAVAVLIIACPCALGLATPMAITVGMGCGAREGILFRDAESLEQLGRIDTLFIDKTGTLTEGRPTVNNVVPEEGLNKETLLSIAAAVEQMSEHPIARSIVQAAQPNRLSLPLVTGFQSIPGVGVQGLVDGKLVEVGWKADGEIETSGNSLALMTTRVSVDGKIVGRIDFADAIRETAIDGLRDLDSLAVRVCILTGDHPASAQRVASELCIDNSSVFAGLLPKDKLSHVEQSRKEGHLVAMAGDGINDAPALAAANVGISLGTGTDIAKQSAGVILVQPDLRRIARAIRISRNTSANIRQNLIFAFAYNAIGIPIAAGVLYPYWGITLSPMFAAVAMSLSSVSVIANALRLRAIPL